MDLAKLQFSVDTSAIDNALKQFEKLEDAVENLGKVNPKGTFGPSAGKFYDAQAKKAENLIKTQQLLQKTIDQLQFKSLALAQGFKSSEASVLAMLRLKGVTEDALSPVKDLLKQINAQTGKNPFDDSLGGIRRVEEETKKLQAQLAALKQGSSEAFDEKQFKDIERITASIAAEGKIIGLTQDEINKKTQETIVLYNQARQEYTKQKKELSSLLSDNDKRLNKEKAILSLEEQITREKQKQSLIKSSGGKLSVSDAELIITQKAKTGTDALALSLIEAKRQTSELAKSFNQINESPIKVVSKELDKLSKQLGETKRKAELMRQGLSATTAQGTIRLEGLKAKDEDIKQYQKFRSEIEKINKENQRAGGSFEILKRSINQVVPLFGALGAVALAAQGSFMFLSAADQIKTLEARIKVADGATSDYKATLAELTRIAIDNKTALEPVIQFYGKVSPALQQLGASTDTAATVTDSFSKVLRISGSSGEQAAAGMLQFSQALGSGRLAGDEFRSITENVAGLLPLLAKELGVNTGELKQLAAEGKITSDVLAKSLVRNFTELNERAALLPLTLKQGFNNIVTQAKVASFQIDEAVGFTKALADSFDNLSKIIPQVTPQLIQGFVEAKKAINDYSGLLNGLIAGYTAYKLTLVATFVVEKGLLAFNATKLAFTTALTTAQKALNFATAAYNLTLLTTESRTKAVTAVTATLNTVLGTSLVGLALKAAAFGAAFLGASYAVDKLSESSDKAVDANEELNKKLKEYEEIKTRSGQRVLAVEKALRGEDMASIEAQQEKINWYDKELEAIKKVAAEGTPEYKKLKANLDAANVARDLAIKSDNKLADSIKTTAKVQEKTDKVSLNAYRGLIDKIGDYKIQLNERLQGEKEVSKSQLIQKDLMDLLLKGNSLLNASTIKKVLLEAEQLSILEEKIKLQEIEQKGLEGNQKRYLKALEDEKAKTQDVNEETKKLQERLEELNETKKDVEAIEQKRIEKTLAETRAKLLANDAEKKFSEEQIDLINEQIVGLEKSLKIREEIKNKLIAKENLESVEKLVDLFSDIGARGAKSFFKNFSETLKLALQKQVFRVLLQGALGIDSKGESTGGGLLNTFVGSAGNSLFNSAATQGLSGLFGSAGAYQLSVPGLSSSVAGSQAAMLAAQTAEFGAGGLAATSAAAGSGLGAAAGGLASAAPYIGAAIVAYQLLSKKGGGPKTEGGFGVDFTGNGALNDQAKQIADQTVAQYNEITKALGVKAKELAISLFIGQDPQGTAMTQLGFRADVSGQRLYDRTAMGRGYENVGRSSEALAQAVAEEQIRAVVTALKETDLSEQAKAILAPLDAVSSSIEQLNAGLAALNGLASIQAQKKALEAELFDLTATDLEKLNKQREQERLLIDSSNQALFDQITDIKRKALEANQQQAQDTEVLTKATENLNKAFDAEKAKQQSIIDRVKTFQDILKNAYDNQSNSLKATIDKFRQFASALLEFRQQLARNFALQGGSPLAAQSNFRSIANSALAGDENAIGALQGASQEYLDAFKMYSTDFSSYRDAFGEVQSILTQVGDKATETADVAERQLLELKQQVESLIQIEQASVSVEQAMQDLINAQADAAVAQKTLEDLNQQQTSLLGQINESILSLPDALAAFMAAKGAAASIGVAGGGSKPSGGGSSSVANALNGPLDSTTAVSIISGMYKNVLGREPDTQGLLFWADQALKQGSVDAIFGDFKEAAKANGEIPKFANGGIVNKATLAMIGEGSMNEAVVPLPNGKSIPVDFGGSPLSTLVAKVEELTQEVKTLRQDNSAENLASIKKQTEMNSFLKGAADGDALVVRVVT